MPRPPMTVRFVSRLALAFAVLATGLPASACAAGGPDGADERGSRPVAERPDAANVSMKFFNKPWPAVLRSVAEQSGSTLVMKDVPTGRFSRFDRAAYTREEAVRFLNRELEPEGFRILEQGPNLVVLHERSVRQRYRRPVSPDAAGRRLSPADHGRAELPAPAPRARNFGSVLPQTDAALAPAGHTARSAAEKYGRADFARTAPGGRRVTTADLTDGFGGRPAAVFPAGDERADEPTPARRLADADAEPPKTVTVRVGRDRAKVVARTLLAAVKPHFKLVDAGPGGLPAFEAYRPAEDAAGRPAFAGGPAFTVGVDEDRDELVVVAPGERADRVAAALRRIDAGPARGAAQRVVAGTPETARVGREVAPILARIAAARQDGVQPPPPALGPQGAGQNPQGQAGQGQNADGQGPVPPPTAADLPGIIQNLRSDVKVEEFGDTGVLILSGNEDDLAAVQKVIERLEALSAGLQPQITFLLLQNVDAVPLAELLSEVYTELERVRNRGQETPSRVTVLPVGKPNGIIIIASETEFPAVERLATQLDRPVPAGTQLEVFRLEHANAPQVATAIENFYADREGLLPQVRVFADVRTNSVVVNAAPNGLAEVAKLIADLDAGTSGLVTRLEVVALEFATAEVLAETINQALQQVLNPARAAQGVGGGGAAAGGQAAQDLQAARSVIVEYVTATGQTARSGLLADVSVAPDPTGNRLILTAPEGTMPLLVALVAALDAPSGARADVKLFTLENADAEAAVELLRELFETGGGTAGQTAAPTGVSLEGTADAGSNLVPLRFSADARTQTVLAIGGEDALAIVEAVLLRLDDESRNQQQFFTVKLVNTPADQVALSLQSLILGRRDLLTVNPLLTSTVELIERDVVVIPEIFSNRLLIYASDRSRDEILRLVRQIDEAPPQVAIQVLLVEVDLTNTDEFGVELGFQDSTLFDRSVSTADDLLTITQTSTAPNGVQTTTEQIISQTAVPGFNFNNTNLPLGNNTGTTNPGTIGTQLLNNFALGRANADLGFGGFVFSASSGNVSALIRALAAKRSVHVLSRPSVTVLDQQVANIVVGQEVPVVSDVAVTNGVAVPSVVREESGLILNVTPRISPDGTVFMNVGAERSSFLLDGVPIFTDSSTGAVVTSPIKNVTATNTFVSVPNGQTIVLGGIITSTEAVDERKVPYLGDIPFVGQLFRTDSTVTTRSELLIFLTPRIIYTDADFELIKQVESDRLHYLEHEAEAIHGPLFGVPPEPGADGYEPGFFGAPGAAPGPPRGAFADPYGPPAGGAYCPPAAPAGEFGGFPVPGTPRSRPSAPLPAGPYVSPDELREVPSPPAPLPSADPFGPPRPGPNR